MDNNEKKKIMNKIIHKDLEPGIINDEMIKNEVLAGYKGEAGRLARLEPVDLSVVTVLRLEFQSKFTFSLIFPVVDHVFFSRHS